MTIMISKVSHMGFEGPMLLPSSAKRVSLKQKLSYIRVEFRQYAAEFLGTMLLVIFGTAVNCQATLSSNSSVSASPCGDSLSVSIGWGTGIAMGVWLSSGMSSGHINPAVTLAMAVWRDFPWKKVPGYITSQVLGALVGAGIVYANYFHAIDAFEGGSGLRSLRTAGLFATYAAGYMTNVSAFFSEFVATAVLLIGLLALTDKRNGVNAGLVPVGLFILVTGIAAGLGMETGFAINPARDLGPRLLTSMVGYGKEVYDFRRQYWLWCPILATIAGAQFGTFVYDLLLSVTDDSILNAFFNSESKGADPELGGDIPLAELD